MSPARTPADPSGKLASGKPARKPQKRTEETKRLLLVAAKELFSSLGFEAVTVASIEEAAGVQRGLLAYHFGSKDELWRGVVDPMFADLDNRTGHVADALQTLPDVDILSALIAIFIRFSAENPELQRLIIQESKLDSWRMEYLVDTHIKVQRDGLEKLINRKLNVHDYYIFIGASSFVFSAQHECKRMWGIDPCTEEFAIEHAKSVAALLRQYWAQQS